MKLLVAALLVASTLSTAQAAKFHVAPDCKKGACRHEIARCVKDACAQFRGIVRVGCKRAARITLNNACTVFGDYARFCADLEVGNGCTPD
ncbi:MAG TPA: hypothetical protein VGR62_00965 [Candidatus Binatia bacterium]|jgi:hypothetical protein|nr:hypothetical protein [Candidatus Binatia bacterium]